MSTTRKHLAATAAVLAVFVVPACSRSVDGQSIASTATISSSATTTTTRTTTAAPTTTTTSPAAPLSIDEVVATAITETQTYWELFGDVDTEFRVEEVSGALLCNRKQWADASMLYCDGVPGDNAFRWNRDRVQDILSRGGEDAVRIVVAHEITHAAQDADGRDYPTREAQEASADCGAGAFIASTGTSRARVNTALSATHMGDPGRVDDFNYGWDNLVDPAACLDYTG